MLFTRFRLDYSPGKQFTADAEIIVTEQGEAASIKLCGSSATCVYCSKMSSSLVTCLVDFCALRVPILVLLLQAQQTLQHESVNRPMTGKQAH